MEEGLQVSGPSLWSPRTSPPKAGRGGGGGTPWAVRAPAGEWGLWVRCPAGKGHSVEAALPLTPAHMTQAKDPAEGVGSSSGSLARPDLALLDPPNPAQPSSAFRSPLRPRPQPMMPSPLGPCRAQQGPPVCRALGIHLGSTPRSFAAIECSSHQIT